VSESFLHCAGAIVTNSELNHLGCALQKMVETSLALTPHMLTCQVGWWQRNSKITAKCKKDIKRTNLESPLLDFRVWSIPDQFVLNHQSSLASFLEVADVLIWFGWWPQTDSRLWPDCLMCQWGTKHMRPSSHQRTCTFLISADFSGYIWDFRSLLTPLKKCVDDTVECKVWRLS